MHTQILFTIVECGWYHYLELFSKYMSKNIICIKKGIVYGDHFSKHKSIVQIAVENSRDLKWFKLLFDLCSKVDIAPKKDDFTNAINHSTFNTLSKECQSIIKENYNKFYNH